MLFKFFKRIKLNICKQRICHFIMNICKNKLILRLKLNKGRKLFVLVFCYKHFNAISHQILDSIPIKFRSFVAIYFTQSSSQNFLFLFFFNI